MQQAETQAGGKLDVYQAYFGEAQRQHVSPAAIPHDVSGNTGNDQREYELFRRIHAARLGNGAPWGLVSSKFELKTMVPLEHFAHFAQAHLDNGADCVFINGAIGNEAVYSNVWEQWWVVNEEVQKLCAFLETVAPICSQRPMGVETFCCFNYFVGNSRFWEAYFAYVERFSAALEEQGATGTPIGQFYTGSGGYHRNMEITTRPFIIERMLSSFLECHPQIGRASWHFSEAAYHDKFGLRLGGILHTLSAIKNRAISTGDQALYAEWSALRSEVFAGAMNLIWTLDDPDELMISPKFGAALAAAGPLPVAG